MSKIIPPQPRLYVYAHPSNKKGISYCSVRDSVATAGSLSDFDHVRNPVQTAITVQSLQNHLKEGYDLTFDINPTDGNHSPINPRIKSYLESKLKPKEKSKK